MLFSGVCPINKTFTKLSYLNIAFYIGPSYLIITKKSEISEFLDFSLEKSIRVLLNESIHLQGLKNENENCTEPH